VESADLLAAVERENRALHDAALGVLRRSVPGCPGWDVAQVVRHLGAVHRWAAGIVRSDAGSRPRRDNQPAEPVDAALPAWFEEGLAELLETFRSTDPEKPCWTWTGPQSQVWWRRRQALEAAIHRVDVEQASGVDRPVVDGELAVVGVDEMLEIFLPLRKDIQGLGQEGRTLHLHATDRPGEWLLRMHAAGIECSRGHARGDAALRGTASDLFLFVWNRLGEPVGGSLAAFEVFGDPDVPALYQRIVTGG